MQNPPLPLNNKKSSSLQYVQPFASHTQLPGAEISMTMTIVLPYLVDGGPTIPLQDSVTPHSGSYLHRGGGNQ